MQNFHRVNIIPVPTTNSREHASYCSTGYHETTAGGKSETFVMSESLVDKETHALLYDHINQVKAVSNWMSPFASEPT